MVRGIATSSAAHGGAVVTMSDEPEAFPFAVLTMNLSAAAAVLLPSRQGGRLGRPAQTKRQIDGS